MRQFAAVLYFLAMFVVGAISSLAPIFGPAAAAWWLSDDSLTVETALDRFVPALAGVVLVSHFLPYVGTLVFFGSAVATILVFWGHYLLGIFRGSVPEAS